MVGPTANDLSRRWTVLRGRSGSGFGDAPGDKRVVPRCTSTTCVFLPKEVVGKIINNNNPTDLDE
ncbi:diphosphate--fructose-6-phosphate 1-phosphotransferase [Anopheles sinensis]|uniref:Diphosphate--fructose-6-phosphate 1-phosphotransferase n=1 Tax=Anopheles sinensis TaxID=74873 RepID=A0A084VXP4_ANOSI|nr:diphosphate--fructose-6-phosphate 1-phosphotransferase [Anopheles sinensis]